jgi:REP element-mobilizing transposase RayT
MKRASKQIAMPGFEAKTALSFGGGTRGSKTNPVSARPISTKQAIHLVMRSEIARGSRSLLLHAGRIEGILKKQARRHGVRLYRLANAGNHLHIVVKLERRGALAPLLRATTGLIARLVLKAERGRPALDVQKAPSAFQHRPTRFWDARPFSRLIAWGKDYLQVKDYLELNTLETKGFAKADGRILLSHLEEYRRQGKLDRYWRVNALTPLGFLA